MTVAHSLREEAEMKLLSTMKKYSVRNTIEMKKREWRSYIVFLWHIYISRSKHLPDKYRSTHKLRREEMTYDLYLKMKKKMNLTIYEKCLRKCLHVRTCYLPARRATAAAPRLLPLPPRRHRATPARCCCACRCPLAAALKRSWWLLLHL